MTDREKELERLLREVEDYFNGSPMPTPVRAASAFLASSPAQEERRYTLAEVLTRLSKGGFHYGFPKSWSDLENDLRDALKETP